MIHRLLESIHLLVSRFFGKLDDLKVKWAHLTVETTRSLFSGVSGGLADFRTRTWYAFVDACQNLLGGFFGKLSDFRVRSCRILVETCQNLLGGIFGRLNDASAKTSYRIKEASGNLVGSPLGNLDDNAAKSWRKFSDLYKECEAKLEATNWFRWLRWILRTTRITLAALFDLGTRWMRSRDYKRVWKSLPALLLVVPLVFLLIGASLGSSMSKVRHYQTVAENAVEDEDFETAQLCYRKIQQLGAGVENALFKSAIALAKDEDMNGAQAAMRQLVEEYDSVAARLWLAHYLIDDEKINNFGKAEEHIDRVLKFDPNHPMAIVLKSQVLHRQGEVNSAIELLSKMVSNNPQETVRLASMHYFEGNHAAMASACRTAIDYYEDRSSSGELNQRDVLGWASANLMLGNHPQMISAIDKGVELFGADRSFAQLMVDECIRYSREFTLGEDTRFQLLVKAHSLQPDDVRLYDQLAETRGVDAELRPLLEEAIDRGSPHLAC